MFSLGFCRSKLQIKNVEMVPVDLFLKKIFRFLDHNSPGPGARKLAPAHGIDINPNFFYCIVFLT